ncbi:MAG: porin [Pseudomonadota bacterium]
MRRVLVTIAVLAASAPALAQSSDSPWEVSQEAELAVIVAPGGSSSGDVERENALYEIGLGLSGERILQSGWTIGGRAVFRASRDHRDRPGGARNVLGADTQGIAGGFSRLSLGPVGGDTGPRGSLETAYLFVETGYGEFSLGRDTGIAARFHEGDVSALSRGRLVDPYLDVSGIGAIDTRANLTGPSTKASYVTPRILGVRAGVSYTPRADVRGLDRDSTGAANPPRAELENAVEIGLNASRRLRESGVRLRGGLSYSTAELDAPAGFEGLFDDSLDVIAVGGEVEWQDTYRFGVNWLLADEGLVSGGDYTAWSAGLGYERGDWRASVVYGASEIDSIGADSEGISLSLAREINDGFTLAVSWQDRDVTPLVPNSQSIGARNAESDGFVVEITLAFKN